MFNPFTGQQGTETVQLKVCLKLCNSYGSPLHCYVVTCAINKRESRFYYVGIDFTCTKNMLLIAAGREL